MPVTLPETRAGKYFPSGGKRNAPAGAKSAKKGRRGTSAPHTPALSPVAKLPSSKKRRPAPKSLGLRTHGQRLDDHSEALAGSIFFWIFPKKKGGAEEDARKTLRQLE